MIAGMVESWSQWLVGASDGRSTYAITRWIFLRGLGLIYLIAFASLWVQVKGLIGSQGILPAEQSLQALKAYLGPDRFRVVPTLFWLGSSDLALQLACAAGVGCALLLVGNVAPIPALIALWVLYLSLAGVGRDFLAFQWDVLLLEAGLLAIFFAPGRVLPGRDAAPVPAVVLLLLWWLLFRLTFQSGLTKLTWGDPVWRDGTALDYHFFTQPLPTWTAWFAQQLPSWVKRVAVLVMYVLEIGFPLLIFGPRGARLVACAGIVVLQIAIFKTGNYTFFNVLTVILALLLVDDAAWARVLPDRFIQGFAAAPGPPGLGAGAIRTVLAVLVLTISAVKFWDNLSPTTSVPPFAVRLVRWADPFRSVNSYGLFRVMTTSRSEIIIEGSDDGSTWRAYEFKYKPGDVTRRPGFVEPHQPRLDWQMWFAALDGNEATPWFQRLLARLLEGSPDVIGLLAGNPFPAHPPRYIRAMRYDYRFTTVAERKATGAWWSRTLVGEYSPAVSLAP